jgi:hypothetical protein
MTHFEIYAKGRLKAIEPAVGWFDECRKNRAHHDDSIYIITKGTS